METSLYNKHKNVVKKGKKSVSMRWLSLHAFADGVHEEYVGSLEAFSKLEIERGSGGSMAKGSSKSWQSLLECCIH